MQQKQVTIDKKLAEAPKRPKGVTQRPQQRRKSVNAAESKAETVVQKKEASLPHLEQRNDAKKTQQRRRRKKTNEDSLIELANRSDS